jgi:hypothetical protein
LKTYGGDLSKKKHIQIVKCVEKHYSTSVFVCKRTFPTQENDSKFIGFQLHE